MYFTAHFRCQVEEESAEVGQAAVIQSIIIYISNQISHQQRGQSYKIIPSDTMEGQRHKSDDCTDVQAICKLLPRDR